MYPKWDNKKLITKFFFLKINHFLFPYLGQDGTSAPGTARGKGDKEGQQQDDSSKKMVAMVIVKNPDGTPKTDASGKVRNT